MTTNHIVSASRIALFSLEDGNPLLVRICKRLGIKPGRHEERQFEDGEHKIRPLEEVRGRDVYVVQSIHGSGSLSVNDRLIRTLFFLGALRDAGAARLTAVIPYLCYARKDMRTKARDPLSQRYVAGLFESVGVDRMVVMDVHNRAAYQNAFRVPAEHLTAAHEFAGVLEPQVGRQELVVVSPDVGGVKRAERFRQILEERLGREVGSAFVEKYRSEGVIRGGTLVGEVKGRVAIIVDDLISSGGTLVRAAEACLDSGAEKAFAVATHGVFSEGAGEVLGDSALERVVVMDTIAPDHVDGRAVESWLEVVDCAPLLAGAIRALHAGESTVGFSDVIEPQ